MIEGTAPGSRPRVAGTTVPVFEQMTVTVRPGSEVVVRLAGILLVARAADTDEGDRELEAVLTLIERSEDAGTRAPGYRLSRALRSLIEEGRAPADLALVAATDDGLAIVLAGSGAIAVPERGWRLVCEPGAVLTREVDWPPAPLVLDLGGPDRSVPAAGSLPGAGERAPSSRTVRPYDLRAGVVPGGGAVLAAPRSESVPSSTGTYRLGSGPVLTPPPPGSARSSDRAPKPPLRSDRILGVEPAGARRPSLLLPVTAGRVVESGAGVDSGAAVEAVDEAVAGAQVLGYRCRDSHLNDPRALFCAICGIRMAERTCVLVEGPRPTLGLLVFDNGASFSLDESYLLGREPDVDERVRTGHLRPLVLFDTGGVISRRHAEIRLEDWDVLLLDCGSANGTLVAEREAAQWSALVPGQPVRMLPGMQVRIGERSFVYEPLHGAA
ncbi:MAG: FHA domain-containing protein [Actinomycetota bacterium]|nr:FHA domain-containing protein [Actinomycetota bacterium]